MGEGGDEDVGGLGGGEGGGFEDWWVTGRGEGGEEDGGGLGGGWGGGGEGETGTEILYETKENETPKSIAKSLDVDYKALIEVAYTHVRTKEIESESEREREREREIYIHI